LLAEFLEHLCEKTGKGEPLTAAIPPGAQAPSAGQTPSGAQAPSPAQASPIPGDSIYCTTAESFRTDEKTPPVIALLTKNLRTGERAGVQLQLSKVSSVSMSVKLGEKTVWTNSA